MTSWTVAAGSFAAACNICVNHSIGQSIQIEGSTLQVQGEMIIRLNRYKVRVCRVDICWTNTEVIAQVDVSLKCKSCGALNKWY